MMDFIIPCHPKDFPSLNLSVNGLKNVSSVNRIFIISKEDPKIDNCIYVSEDLYSQYITREQIEILWSQKNPFLTYRSKWLYQQFLKLLSVRVINDLTNSFVIVDADTIFLNDVNFEENVFHFCKAEEYHNPYLEPIKSLFGIEETIGFSCICHHLNFQKDKLLQMITEIENKFHTDFVSAVIGVIDFNEASCFSEWDTYSNFMLLRFPEMCKHRQLRWLDISEIPNKNQLESYKKEFDFVSCHAYRRGIE